MISDLIPILGPRREKIISIDSVHYNTINDYNFCLLYIVPTWDQMILIICGLLSTASANYLHVYVYVYFSTYVYI